MHFFNVIKNYECANLPEVLLDYVINDNSISTQKRKLQFKTELKLL